jgi:hypothetical protein
VTLAWDSNVEQDIAGYHVAYGLDSGNYTAVVDVGNATSHRIFNLDSNRRYFFAVRAYNFQGIASAFSSEISTTTDGSPLMLTSVSTSQSSPKPVGTQIVFTANATAGVRPYQYKWLVAAATWTMLRDWSTDATFSWQPAIAGSYQVTAWVRNANSTSDEPANSSSSMVVPFKIEAPVQASVETPVETPVQTPVPTPVDVPVEVPVVTPVEVPVVPPVEVPSVVEPIRITVVSASLASPQRVGTAIRFTAGATGGVPPIQFRWLVSSGQGWHVQQDWSTSSSFTYTATESGWLWIRPQVRSATNNTDDMEAQDLMLMTILP